MSPITKELREKSVSRTKERRRDKDGEEKWEFIYSDAVSYVESGRTSGCHIAASHTSHFYRTDKTYARFRMFACMLHIFSAYSGHSLSFYRLHYIYIYTSCTRTRKRGTQLVLSRTLYLSPHCYSFPFPLACLLIRIDSGGTRRRIHERSAALADSRQKPDPSGSANVAPSDS